MANRLNLEARFVIIGGGIAGVSCAESLAFLDPEASVILITASPLIKAVTNIIPLGKIMTQFDVEERQGDALTAMHPSINVIHDIVNNVNIEEKTLETQSGRVVEYEKLCVCTGARPRLICENNPYVIGIRDTESVENLSRKISNARRIIVVGNGGIATEIVHEVEAIQVIWVIKDKHISATFVDPGAAEFFQSKLAKGTEIANERKEEEKVGQIKRIKYKVVDGVAKTVGKSSGAALGPDWHNNFSMKGASSLDSSGISVEYECEVSEILESSEIDDKSCTENWPIFAKLTNGKVIGADLLISATGVLPNSNLRGLEDLRKSNDGGFLVNWEMETSTKDIYAAGDVCTADWDIAEHWFQMRLWTQAHQMGRFVAKSMICSYNEEEFFQDFCFELFTHVTKFFGYKVVLLGLYNGQKLNGSYEIILRMTKDQEYVKLVMKNGKMHGAVLIGETDLEEICENLILDQLDLSIYGAELLNPDIDIEDYFD